MIFSYFNHLFMLYISLFFQVNEAKLSVDNLQVNLGKVDKKEQKIAIFKLTNSGKLPLKIANISSDCHCTVTQLANKIILPNQSTTLKVTIDSTVTGWFQKVITVESNIHEKKTILIVRGRVIE
jgi:LEA14-like dessication related protein